jgi:hypothetical protein
VATWYNCNSSNNKGKLISKTVFGSVYQTLNFELPIGNPNVMQIDKSVSFSLLGFAKVSYDSIKNKFIFYRDEMLDVVHHRIYLSPVTCGQFLGFDNNVEVEITSFGVMSDNKVNVISHKAINIKVSGDIDAKFKLVKEMNIASTSGDINIKIDNKDDLQITSHSLSGECEVKLAGKEIHFEKNGSYQLGNAECKIKLNTVSGDIHLDME